MARIARRQDAIEVDSRKKTSTTSTLHTTVDPTRSTETPQSIVSTMTSTRVQTSTTEPPGPLLTATSRLETAPTSIHWGPPMTAPSLPSTAPPATSIAEPAPSREFSNSAKTTVIAVTTIGGTIILAFLIYALWRRRRGATYSEIMLFRRHSGTIALSSPRPRERLTALPIYRESRYSIRSSTLGSTLDFSNQHRGCRGVVAPQAFYGNSTWKQQAEGPSASAVANASKQPLARANSILAPMVKSPPMARVYTAPGPKGGGLAEDIGKEGPSISVRAASPTGEDDLSDFELPNEGSGRWSWTNSQAPPTPRMYAPSLRSSLTSIPRFRKVKSWVRNQQERRPLGINEKATTKVATTAAAPVLQNKASKPNLAPKPTRKLSKKSARRDSSATLLIQSNVDPPDLPAPEPAWMRK